MSTRPVRTTAPWAASQRPRDSAPASRDLQSALGLLGAEGADRLDEVPGAEDCQVELGHRDETGQRPATVDAHGLGQRGIAGHRVEELAGPASPSSPVSRIRARQPARGRRPVEPRREADRPLSQPGRARRTRAATQQGATDVAASRRATRPRRRRRGRRRPGRRAPTSAGPRTVLPSPPIPTATARSTSFPAVSPTPRRSVGHGQCDQAPRVDLARMQHELCQQSREPGEHERPARRAPRHRGPLRTPEPRRAPARRRTGRTRRRSPRSRRRGPPEPAGAGRSGRRGSSRAGPTPPHAASSRRAMRCPAAGAGTTARNPNSSWITPPRLSIPSTRPLIAASAPPEDTASA